MSKELEVNVDKFEPRWYQLPIINAIERDGYRRLIVILPRRAGKDVMALNILLRQAFKRVGYYFYLFPKIGQGRRAIWDSILIDGTKFMDFIPSELIKGKANKVEMKVELINGSIIQFYGTDKIENLLSTNAMGVVYSEYAYTNNPLAWNKISPMLAGNNGWALFISTPYGHGMFYELYKRASVNPKWHITKLTVNETKHILPDELEEEKRNMSEDMFAQEYLCSFDAGILGAYYSKYYAKALAEGRIGSVPHDTSKKVCTFWDIGVDDSTSIIFAQIYENKINIIDYYENNNVGLEDYVSVIRSKSYVYGTHIAPNDIMVREWGHNATSRIDSAAKLGLHFKKAPRSSLMAGIEKVRLTFSRLWIDEEKCKGLTSCIENYRKEWDSINKRYHDTPKRNFATHGASALMYLCLSLGIVSDDAASAKELQDIYNKEMYGSSGLPSVFGD